MKRASLSAVLALAFAGPSARADELERCATAHEAAQEQRTRGALLDAHASLEICASASCPALVIRDCQKWLEEVTASLSTVVIAARDPRGRTLADVRVIVDGRVVADRLGEPLLLEPGSRVLRLERAGSRPLERRVVLEPGARDISVVLEPREAPKKPRPTPKAEEPSGPSPWAWGIGAAGVVGIGVFAGFAISGLVRRNELEDLGCKPRCPESDVAAMERDFLVADVALGIGLAGLAAGAIVFAVTFDGGSRSGGATDSRLGVAWRTSK